ncbi:hypothetical protein ACQKLX_22310 [Bosea sp. NPDC003192]|uniref:hypothetical protein n=1 Tax=Bosea sp. NPDC003192 TaxID=3390551 RepID=UPI003CFE7FB3
MLLPLFPAHLHWQDQAASEPRRASSGASILEISRQKLNERSKAAVNAAAAEAIST